MTCRSLPSSAASSTHFTRPAACPRRRRFYRATLSVAAAECRVSLDVALQVVLDGLFLPLTFDVKDGLCLFDSQYRYRYRYWPATDSRLFISLNAEVQYVGNSSTLSLLDNLH